MRRVYCLSGLGADERIFSKLKIPDTEFIHVSWIMPEKNESLEKYTKRLSQFVTMDNPVFIGLSFGGMVSIEMAKLFPNAKIILISSITSKNELPLWMKICGVCKLYKLMPSRQISTVPGLKSLRPIQNYFLGAVTAEEKQIANTYRDTVDPVYLNWAIRQVLIWKNDYIPKCLFHIHGDCDHIFPVSKLKPTHIISGGGHFMIMNKYQQINSILQQILQVNC